MKLSTVYSTQPSKFEAVAWSKDLEKSLKYFKDLGYEGIELAVRDPEKLDLQSLKNVPSQG